MSQPRTRPSSTSTDQPSLVIATNKKGQVSYQTCPCLGHNETLNSLTRLDDGELHRRAKASSFQPVSKFPVQGLAWANPES
jgi:hypothetical protein